jgi:uroporphyrinogen-III decarboxylase
MSLKTTMNSRSRIICTLENKEPDHVPLYFLMQGWGEPHDPRSGFTFGNINRYDTRREFSYRHQIRKAEEMLKLGLDDMLRIEPLLGWAEEYMVEGVSNINVKFRKYFSDDKSKEFLEKIYLTPAGELKTAVQKTGDWPHGDDIPVFSDYSVSRAKEFLIKTRKDLERLKYLLNKPKREEYLKFREESGEIRKASAKLGVALEGGRTSLGDSLFWLLGMQNMIYGAYDSPDFIVELLDILLQWEEKRLEMIIDEGIELLFHSAWYEITDFWTPEMYRKILKPRIKSLIEICRQAGVKFVYIITKSFKELADDFLDMGIDSVFGVDPVQGQADLKGLAGRFNGKISIWGGINSAVTLGRGSQKEIEKAVEEAIRILAPGGGFVLYPVDVVLPEANPWDNIEIMLNKWRNVGSYPIDLR